MSIVADGFIHRQQVLNRDLGLNVMNGVKNKPSAFAKNLETLTYLGAHFIRRAKWQGALGVHAAALRPKVRTTDPGYRWAVATAA